MLPVPPPRIPELGVPYPCTRIHSKGIAPVLVGYSTQFPGISFSCNYGPDVTICVSPAIGSLFQEACYVGIEIRKERRFCRVDFWQNYSGGLFRPSGKACSGTIRVAEIELELLYSEGPIVCKYRLLMTLSDGFVTGMIYAIELMGQGFKIVGGGGPPIIVQT